MNKSQNQKVKEQVTKQLKNLQPKGQGLCNKARWRTYGPKVNDAALQAIEELTNEMQSNLQQWQLKKQDATQRSMKL